MFVSLQRRNAKTSRKTSVTGGVFTNLPHLLWREYRGMVGHFNQWCSGICPIFFPLWSKESMRLHLYMYIYLCHIRLHYCSTWLKLQGRFMLFVIHESWFLHLLTMKVLTEDVKNFYFTKYSQMKWVYI